MRGVWLFDGNPAVELFENRTQFMFVAAKHGAQKHASCNAKKFPPELAGLLQSVRAERFDFKACRPQRFCGFLYGGASFSSNRRTAVVLKVADSNFLQLGVCRPAHGNWRGRGIANVRSLHRFEENLQI